MASNIQNPIKEDKDKDKKKQEEEEKKADEDFVKQLELVSYKVRRTPELYRKEVTQYYSEFKQTFEKVKENPLQKNKKFAELAVFLARIAQFYKFEILEQYVTEFLDNYANQMNPFLRKKMVASLMILRSKNLLKPNTDGIAKRSLQIMITLYKKNIWIDQKTINIIASGCLNDSYKIKLISCFFLVATTELEEYESDSSDDDDDNDKDKREKKGVTKKTKAKIARMEREKKNLQKNQEKE
ncbi:sda1 domain protein 1 [Ichthyophthirius multifiliis]|uniref:Protein SDA1 n=1 Tax=Ichthyophthirius multifiliis TaxID=5932 RepID=G0R4G3_ICHMU|nr:sda1 domain protein 1 [Ichthyophthirius multifiliis]EGR27638.1 sda1 domain protein 1 [Ichthyophthirius multifiliis]|eukprot:XP_004025090.1 sda1 domain protein 1 [Ichthyophthirius multifiliis]